MSFRSTFLIFSPGNLYFLAPNRKINIFNPRRFFSTDNQDKSPSLRLVRNQKIVLENVQEFVKKAALFKNIHIDLGTGDGKFIYRLSKISPETYFIGIDANQSSMNYISWKVCRKPSRGGGQNNIAFIQSNIESLPESFNKVGDTISINFPWGSLMEGLVVPNESLLSKIALLGKEGCFIEILLNYSIFQDHVYRQKLKLPHLTLDYAYTHLKRVYSSTGINISEISLQVLPNNRSTWGQHLTLGSGRQVLRLCGQIKNSQIKK